MALRLRLENDSQWRYARYLAKERREHSEAKGFHEHVIPDKPWLYTPEAKLQRELDGFVTEMLVAKHFNLYFDPTVDRNGQLPDVGRNTQVKCRMHPGAGLQLWKDHRVDQVYVLCWRVYDGKPLEDMSNQIQRVYDLVGWTWGWDVKQDEYRRKDGSWVMPAKHLTPID